MTIPEISEELRQKLKETQKKNIDHIRDKALNNYYYSF